ncbi:hypothetical protein [Streptomyces sp. HD]|uniref:hypothetical protein n=1 Tax=Streptomyces sp. HD TaxID=3020892 RepID=UPI00232BD73A|nr:hypothetical protein [Streptomyces sp. HD]MDC0768644.1 hypothetical protein [Streptomyces sp. HD]
MVAPLALATVVDAHAERPALVVDLDWGPDRRDLSCPVPTVHTPRQDSPLVEQP